MYKTDLEFLRDLYAELSEAPADGGPADWACGAIYDRIGSEIRDEKARAVDLAAYEGLGECVNYAKAKPAETAALRRHKSIREAEVAARKRFCEFAGLPCEMFGGGPS